MPLELLLFGPYEARRDGQAISFPTERARALLAYLAMNPDHPQLRQTLAELFWYERSEEAARNSLRTELNRLRQAIDDVNAADPLLVGTRLHIEFVTSAEATVDVHQFKDLLRACRQHSHLKLSSCPPCAERLQTAVALYRGDFLAEIGSVTSPPFEDWLRATQETLRAEALWALEILIEHFNGRGEFERVLHYAHRQLKIQPWREPAHRHIMRALTLQGQRAAALRQYEICRSVLAAELAADPSAETTALYEQIRAGEHSMPALEAQNPYQGLRPFEMIHASFFFGRESTTERLLEAVQRKFLVTLIGASGSGKTSLIQAGLLPRLTAVLPQHPVSNDHLRRPRAPRTSAPPRMVYRAGSPSPCDQARIHSRPWPMRFVRCCHWINPHKIGHRCCAQASKICWIWPMVWVRYRSGCC